MQIKQVEERRYNNSINLKQGPQITNHLLTKIKDESFDVDLLSQFDLCLQFEDNRFNFCVIDTISNRCLLLESYNLINHPEKTVLQQLQEIFEDHHVLMAGFWKSVKVCARNKNFSLVPNYLYIESAMDKYLTCHTSIDPYVHALYEYKHLSSDSVNVFAVDSALIQCVKKYYANKELKIVHHTSSMIEGVMKDQQSMTLRTMYLMVQKQSFTVLVKNENILEYCNTFSFTSTDEFIFYLIFVTSTLNVNRKLTKIILLGDIDKDSDEYSRILQYFKFVSFGVKPAYLRYGYVFDEIPEHHFFDLYSTYLC